VFRLFFLIFGLLACARTKVTALLQKLVFGIVLSNLISSSEAGFFMHRKYRFIILLLLIIVAYTITKAVSQQSAHSKMVGVYWGAFDPPTQAHYEIIKIAVETMQIKKLIVVVNNNSYKNYTFPLDERKNMIQKKVKEFGLVNIEILEQDDFHKIDFTYLNSLIKDPLCAIAGYDAYARWKQYSSKDERNQYDAIAVVPRGDDDPILFDQNAFIMPISAECRYVSSTQVRKQLALLR
jgi:cytidyltransferase-like protein